MVKRGGEKSQPRDPVGTTVAVLGALSSILGSLTGRVAPTFVATAAASAIALVSAVRIGGLVYAPFSKRSKCRWNAEHWRRLGGQVLLAVLSGVLVWVAVSLPATASTIQQLAKMFLGLSLAVFWLASAKSFGAYATACGGVLTPLPLARRVLDALDIIPGTPNPDRVRRVLFQCLAATVIVAIPVTTAEAHVRHNPPPPPTPAKQGHEPTESPSPSSSPTRRSDPYADDRCDYNVANKIALGVPDHVASALAAVLINPDKLAGLHAPGVDEAGCPDEGTRRVDTLWVTPLSDPDASTPAGLLVSDSDGNAAVVFETLRPQVENLLGQGRLVRVSRRYRTSLGDLQVLFLDGESCAVAVREYNHAYLVLTGVARQQFTTEAVAHREIPRLRPRDAAAQSYTLVFGLTRPAEVPMPGGALVSVIEPPEIGNVPVSDVPCTGASEFLDLLAITEPAPESTP